MKKICVITGAAEFTETAGKYIARVADKKTKKPICTIGFSYKLVCFLAEILPSRLLNTIVYRLYAG